jgi:hypothetical protein
VGVRRLPQPKPVGEKLLVPVARRTTVSETPPDESDRLAAALDRASAVFAVVAGVAFLASFPLAGSERHTTVVSIAVALGGGSLFCGEVSTLRNPQEMVGNSVPSPGVPTDDTVTSRYQARSYGKLYLWVGVALFVGGGFAALSTL